MLTDRSPCLSQCFLQRSHPHQSFERHLAFQVSFKVMTFDSSMSPIGGIFLGFSGTDSDDEDVHSTVNTTVISKSPVRTPSKQLNNQPGETSSLVKTPTLPVIPVSDNSNGNTAKQPIADETKSAKSKRKKSTKDRSRSPSNSPSRDHRAKKQHVKKHRHSSSPSSSSTSSPSHSQKRKKSSSHNEHRKSKKHDDRARKR